MEKGRTRLRWLGTLVAVAIVLIYGVVALGREKVSDDSEKARADIIKIDTLKVFGYLEKPEVVFLHDQHTDALEKQGKDCSACHLKEDGTRIPGTFDEAVKGIDRMSPKFKRLKDTARQEVMDIYHTFCIDCHADMTAAEEKTGPVECGGCHNADIVSSSRQPMELDKSLHYRHAEAEKNKCERCHHEYDEKNKKLVYIEGEENSCRYCHKEEREDNRVSMRLASHLACIDCHRKATAKNETAGPVKCAGCHDAEQQKAIKKVSPVPRLKRNQPDQLLIKTAMTESVEDLLRMNPVPFDHKAHEEYNNNCRVCHHASMDTCSKCHTLDGSKDGGGIKLERAMHLAKSESSCVGCHNEKLNDPKCAGCHTSIEKGSLKDASCKKCHTEPLEGWAKRFKGMEPQAVAAAMLQSRKPVTQTYDDNDIPENVVIKNLAEKYDPVEFPHRKILKTLLKDTAESDLAKYFHSDAGTLCQGCHHNSPASKKPPRCANCHGEPFDENNTAVPGMLGAYHQQCIGCHEAMEMEKPTDCLSCHKDFKEKHKDYKEKI